MPTEPATPAVPPDEIAEDELDEALEESFPASDPASPTQPHKPSDHGPASAR